jgi:hypothetical protein
MAQASAEAPADTPLLTLFLQRPLAHPPHHPGAVRIVGDVPSAGTRSARASAPSMGRCAMTGLTLVGLLLVVFLIAPLVTARPGRY